MSITSEKINGTLIEVEIKSSNLKFASYDTDSELMTVEFNSGAIYEYKKVPWNKFTKFRLAESQGRYFNENIKKNYTFSKIQ